MPRIIIIGGGISGLATCHYLKKEVPEAELTLFESQKRLGGTLGSERIDGYVFERGANSFLTNHPETLDLALELGLEDRLVAPTPEAKTRYLLKNGKLHPLPTSPMFVRCRSPSAPTGSISASRPSSTHHERTRSRE